MDTLSPEDPSELASSESPGQSDGGANPAADGAASGLSDGRAAPPSVSAACLACVRS
jgi:hypothetical protein